MINKNSHIVIPMCIGFCFLFLQGCTEIKKGEIDLKQVAVKVRREFNAHDAVAIAMLHHKDATYLLPGKTEPLRGRKAIEENYRIFFQAFPDLTMDFMSVTSSEDQFVVEWIVHGTNTGPLTTRGGKILPTGMKIELKGIFLAKVTPDGLLAEDRTYYDRADFMTQMGLSEQLEI